MSIKSVMISGALLVSLGACTEDPNRTKLQYFPDMADTPGVETQINYLEPPEGSIARNAILYPDTPEEAEKLLQNPYLAGGFDLAKHTANGKRLFEIYCVVCHGHSAKGDGPITDKFPRPPDLTLDMYKNRKDGFFFHRMTFGSAIMPSYGHATTANERWEIALHIRELQNAKVAPPAPAASEPAGTVAPVPASSGPSQTTPEKKGKK